MRAPFEIWVALRYLQSRKKAGISLTSFLTVVAFALGVAALTVVTSVWNGFEQEFLDKLLGINAHAMVLKRFDVFRDHAAVAEHLRAQPGIDRVAPFISSEVIGQSAKGIQGLMLKGVDPAEAAKTPLGRYVSDDSAEAEQVFTRLGSFESNGRVDTTERQGRPRYPGILIGHELSRILHVKPGEAISLISPYGSRGGAAREANFEVIGIFRSGLLEFDSRMVFISIEEAQAFLRLFESVSGLEVWTTDPMRSRDLVNAAVASHDPGDLLSYEVKDWSFSNRGIFGAVRQQKLLISIVLFFIVVVAAFMTMATLILLILEKGREVAILKALGASARSILAIFILDGVIIGAVGCALGIGLGLAVCALLSEYGLTLDPRVYFLEQLPIVVRPAEVATVCLGALALATLATLLPAAKAARMRPVDGLTRRTPSGPPGRPAGERGLHRRPPSETGKG